MIPIKTLAAIGFAIACAGPISAEIKIALDSPADIENSGSYVWANTFSEYLNANGMEAVEFERGALGEEAERLDQVSQGLLEVSMSDVKSAGQLSNITYGVYLPYLFENAAGLDAALENGGLLERINEDTTAQGVRVLAFTALGLPSGIFNTKQAVASIEDMSDLRMRALDETQIKLYEAWGSTGTMVSWSEVPNALQTGVADGYLNPPFVPLMFGHTDFIKHFTDASITPAMRIAIASEDWYQGLSDDERGVVDAAVAAATDANRKWLSERTNILEQLEAAGVTVTRLSPEARQAFVEASIKTYTYGVLTEEEVAAWLAAAGR
ncbi:TRAP transporter substrate-binding protein [Seohaeicola saemankumensis]|uniref:TRAP transporter substrate-binding protein n=1 Tax=Seohaeicola saemankumensis TaxID=481181 RepID=UPI0035D0B703